MTADTEPGNTNTNETDDRNWFERLTDWLSDKTGLPSWFWKALFIAIPILLLLPLLILFFPALGSLLVIIFKGVGTVVVWVLKGLLWLICLPIRGIIALVRKIKERRG